MVAQVIQWILNQMAHTSSALAELLDEYTTEIEPSINDKNATNPSIILTRNHTHTFCFKLSICLGVNSNLLLKELNEQVSCCGQHYIQDDGLEECFIKLYKLISLRYRHGIKSNFILNRGLILF